MSNENEERVAYVVEWDGKKFNNGIKKSKKSLNEFEKQMDSLTTDKKGKKKTAEIDVDSTKANSELKKYGENVDKIKFKFSALQVSAVTAITNITNTVVDSAKKIVSSMSSINSISAGYEAYEQNLTSMRTLMNMYGTEEFDNMLPSEISTELEKLSWYCDETSASYENLVATLSSYATAGIDLDDAINSLMGFGNLVNMYGGDASTVNNLVDNIGRAMNIGKMTSASWQQIASTSFAKPILEAAMDAAVELGTLRQNIDGSYKTVSVKEDGVKIVEGGQRVTLQNKNFDTGWLTDDVLTAALEKYSEYSSIVKDTIDLADELEGTADFSKLFDKFSINSESEAAKYLQEYFGATIDGFETTADAMELVDKLIELGAIELEYDFSQAAFQAAQQAKTIGDAIGTVTTGLKTQWANTFEYIIGNAEEVPKLWTSVADSLYRIFVTGQGRNDLLSEWHDQGYEKFAQGISDILEGIALRVEKVRDFFSELFGELDVNKLLKITDGFANFAAKFADVDGQRSGFLEWITNIKEEIGELGAGITKIQIGIIGNNGEVKNSFVTLSELSDKVANGITKVKNVVTDTGEKFKSLSIVTSTLNDNGEAIVEEFEYLIPDETILEEAASGIDDVRRSVGLLESTFERLSSSSIVSSENSLLDLSTGFEELKGLKIDTVVADITDSAEAFDSKKYWSNITGIADGLSIVGTNISNIKIKNIDAVDGKIKDEIVDIDALTIKMQKGTSTFKKALTDAGEEVTILSVEVDELSDSGESVKNVYDYLVPDSSLLTNASRSVGEFKEAMLDISSTADGISSSGNEVADSTKTLGEALYILGTKSDTLESFLNNAHDAMEILIATIVPLIKKVAESVKDVFSDLSEGLKKITDQIKASSFTWKDFVKWTSAIILALYTIVQLKWKIDKVSATVNIVKNLAYALESAGNYLWRASQLMQAKRLATYATMVLLLASAVLVLAFAFKFLSDLEWKELLKGLAGFVVIIGALAAIMIIMNGTIGKFSKSATKLGATLTKLSSKGLLNFKNFVGYLFDGFFKLYESFLMAEKIKAYGKAVLIVSVAVLVLVAALYGLAELTRRYDFAKEILPGLGILVVVIGMIALLMVAIGFAVKKGKNNMLYGMGSLLFSISILIGMMALIIHAFNKIDFQKSANNIASGLSVMTLILLVIGTFVWALAAICSKLLKITKTQKTMILQLMGLIFTVTLLVSIITGLVILLGEIGAKDQYNKICYGFGLIVLIMYSLLVFIWALAGICDKLLRATPKAKSMILQLSVLLTAITLVITVITLLVVLLGELGAKNNYSKIGSGLILIILIMSWLLVFVWALAGICDKLLRTTAKGKSMILQLTVMILAITLSIALLVGTIVLLGELASKDKWKKVGDGLILLILIMSWLLVFIWAICGMCDKLLRLTPKGKTMIWQVALLLAAISIVIWTMIGAILILGNIGDPKKYWVGFARVAALLGMVVGFITLISLILKIEPNMDLKAISSLALMLLAVSATLLIMVGSMILINTYLDNPKEMWRAFAIIASIYAFLIGVVALITLIMKIPGVRANIKTKVLPIVIILAVLTSLVAAVVGLCVWAGRNTETIWAGFGIIAAIFGTLLVVVTGIALVAKYLLNDKKMILGIVLIAAVLFTVIGAVVMLIRECNKIQDTSALTGVTILIATLMSLLVAFAAIIAVSGPVGWAIVAGIGVIALAFLSFAAACQGVANLITAIRDSFVTLADVIEYIQNFSKDDSDALVSGFQNISDALWQILPDTIALLLAFALALRLATGSGIGGFSIAAGMGGGIFASISKLKSTNQTQDVSTADLVTRLETQDDIISEIQSAQETMELEIDKLEEAIYNRYANITPTAGASDLLDVRGKVIANYLDASGAWDLISKIGSYGETPINNSTNVGDITINITAPTDASPADIGKSVLDALNGTLASRKNQFALLK